MLLRLNHVLAFFSGSLTFSGSVSLPLTIGIGVGSDGSGSGGSSCFGMPVDVEGRVIFSLRDFRLSSPAPLLEPCPRIIMEGE
jgi:hypothetical protein